MNIDDRSFEMGCIILSWSLFYSQRVGENIYKSRLKAGFLLKRIVPFQEDHDPKFTLKFLVGHLFSNKYMVGGKEYKENTCIYSNHFFMCSYLSNGGMKIKLWLTSIVYEHGYILLWKSF